MSLKWSFLQLKKKQEQQAKLVKRFNDAALLSEFPEGSKVMALDPLKGTKLSPRYEGPFAVVARISHGSYVPRDGTGVLLKRHYAPSQLKLVIEDYEDTVTYEIERIVGHRQSKVVRNEVEYEVKWKGWDEVTWEPRSQFVDLTCITDYWARVGKATASSPFLRDDSLTADAGTTVSVPQPSSTTSSRTIRLPKRYRS